MSAVQIQGNASGTGTLTIAAPNTNTNQTLTLPDLTGTLSVNGPAFSAYFSGTQSVSSNTITKVTLNTEYFDTASAFNNTGSTVGSTPAYAFLPLVAGYYQFSYGVYGKGTNPTVQAANAQLYKNGVEPVGTYSTGSSQYALSAAEINSTGAFLLYLNGSTDYVELYGKVIGTSVYFAAGYLNGVMVRAA